MLGIFTFTALLFALPSIAQFGKNEGKFFVLNTAREALVIERLDPIMAAGKIPSGHVHSFIGANSLTAGSTHDQLQSANCSTAPVRADKSVYWMPSLYFQDPKNQSLHRVPEKASHKIYYFNRAMANETITEFPSDFRMIAGNPFRRSLNPSEQLQQVTEWFCHGPPVDVKASGFPKGFTECGYGLAGSIHFPHCWNGQNFDTNNPFAHMSYPMGGSVGSGYCPSDFPIVLPHIFIEFWMDTKIFNGLYTANDSPWVLAQGDPTGYGFHADFLNGWEKGVLQKAMDECTVGQSGRSLTECFDMYTNEEIDACKIPPIVNEQIDGWLGALPGCNPIQSGPQMASSVPICSAGSNGPPGQVAPTDQAPSLAANAPAEAVSSPTTTSLPSAINRAVSAGDIGVSSPEIDQPVTTSKASHHEACHKSVQWVTVTRTLSIQ